MNLFLLFIFYYFCFIPRGRDTFWPTPRVMKALSTIFLSFVLPIKRQKRSMGKIVISSISERHLRTSRYFGQIS